MKPVTTSYGLTIVLLLLMATTAATQTGAEKAMAKDANPDFEVATIKRSKPDAEGAGFPGGGRHVSCNNVTVNSILLVAYGIHVKQIIDAPDWLGKDRFDIDGVADVEGIPNFEQTRIMYRKLLATRFHLVLHRETRDLPIYAITIAKGGPILKAATPNEDMNTGNRQNGGQRTLRFSNMSMANFALNMNFYLDRPAIDQTGLGGSYDFTLTWTYDVAKVGDADVAPELFTAIREQAGLKIEAVKGPAPVLVIDHVEHPTEN